MMMEEIGMALWLWLIIAPVVAIVGLSALK